MRIVIAHNAVPPGAAEDDRDVLVQAEAVTRALNSLGHDVTPLACTLDLSHARQRLTQLAPDFVFNLVESLDGRGALIHLFPALLDAMGIPYTGSPAEVLRTTSNKVAAKRVMAARGLPTLAWTGPYPGRSPEFPFLDVPAQTCQSRCWIVKSVWEHASLGLEEDRLVADASPAELAGILKDRAPDLGGSCFAEPFVQGREFNLSLIAEHGRPRVLPPAEIVFEGFAPEKPRLVGYRAKWRTDSFEYRHTPRRFAFAPGEAALIDELTALSLRCWEIFGLRGWARVDFRLDAEDRPWILEINANPCLSPDAGFAAAAARAGLTYAEAVRRIVDGV